MNVDPATKAQHTYKSAARVILAKAGKPLHYQEITRQVLEAQLMAPQGKTPDQSLASQLYTDINNQGPQSRFVLVEAGVFGLREQSTDHPVNVVPAAVVPLPADPATKAQHTYKSAAEVILAKAGKPLHYQEITRQVLEAQLMAPQGKTPDQSLASQLYTDINNQGPQSRFVLVEAGVFGLREQSTDSPENVVSAADPLPKGPADVVTSLAVDDVDGLCSELTVSQIDSSSPVRYERAIAQAFEQLGFEAQHLGKSGQTDVLVIARLGSSSYRAIVDAKSASGGKVSDHAINWLNLKVHREELQAQHAAVVAPSFAGGHLAKRADEYRVALITTDTLIKVLRLHRDTPFSLSDLRDFLATAGASASVLEDLHRHHRGDIAHWRLINEVIELIWDQGKPLNAENIHFILVGKLGLADAPSVKDLEDVLKFLASRAVRIVRPMDDSDHYGPTMTHKTALGRLQALRRVMLGDGFPGEEQSESLTEA